MSSMNGHKLAQQLTSLRPALRVLFMSDCDYSRIARKLTLSKGLALLRKPFTMRTIAEKVRQVLDAPAGGEASRAGAA